MAMMLNKRLQCKWYHECSLRISTGYTFSYNVEKKRKEKKKEKNTLKEK